MLRCLGVYVEHTTRIYGDNAGVILNATIPSSLLKKKHVALSYHMTREAAASGIATPIKISGSNTFSDTLTKAQTFQDFMTLTNGVFYG